MSMVDSSTVMRMLNALDYSDDEREIAAYAALASETAQAQLLLTLQPDDDSNASLITRWHLMDALARGILLGVLLVEQRRRAALVATSERSWHYTPQYGTLNARQVAAA